MKPSDLGQLVPRYFTEHLVGQRDLSANTVASYRDTFRLLLRFLCRTRRTSASMLPVTALNADAVLAFLAHLEAERGNSPRSRNARLAAIRSFVGYLSDLLGPALPEPTRRILTIRSKRYTRRMMGFLTRAEIDALLRATDGSRTGRRNHLLLLLLYNTGARVSEITGVRVRDVHATDYRQVLLHGKGRKERAVPLWAETRRTMRQWITTNELSDDAPLLSNRFGRPLTRSGVAWELRVMLSHARKADPSVSRTKISPHIIRHTTAMHLLQSGVAHELISLWLGHESPETTHGYVEADLEMKRRTLEALDPPRAPRRPPAKQDPLLRFLDEQRLC
ncbi:MAG: tyrosine-type recombinase/integrase [Verrucomicrobiales bacterium]|nr:tyrosine-type recombinase/integrase [Verrucomicrobiales bacterium]